MSYKETKIEIPAGCKVEKTEVVDGALVVTFKKQEPQLPKSWEEFCEMFPIKQGESYINEISVIIERDGNLNRLPDCDKSRLPDCATAEAVLALYQLVQLRDCYNQGWKPNWNIRSQKYVIEFGGGKIVTKWYYGHITSPLYFKSPKLRDEFLEYFRDLIEELKPLYGI